MSKTIKYPRPNKTAAAEPIAADLLSGEKLEHRRAEVNQAVKQACDYLNSDGVEPRNYVEQLAWMFFLKAFDEAEAGRADMALFEGNELNERFEKKFRWSTWTKLT